MKCRTYLLLVLILVIFGGGFAFWPEIIVLHARDIVAMSRKPFDVAKNDVFLYLNAGDEVYIIDCIDTKSDIEFKALDKNGRAGYIYEMNFGVTRKYASLSEIFFKTEFITSKCRGWDLPS